MQLGGISLDFVKEKHHAYKNQDVKHTHFKGDFVHLKVGERQGPVVVLGLVGGLEVPSNIL